jgi:predicted aldo/keto reductase-like oxidoreductase
MQYRTFGRLDWRPSALGFGAMRLPVLHDEHGQRQPGKIDYPAATAMLHYAIDHGVNYVDTAYVYHEGTSETWLRQALAGGYRERVKVATKLPIFQAKTAADFDRLLDEQLERLGLEQIDFYLLHSVENKNWPVARDLGVLDWCDKVLADGRVGHLGFSFHGDAPLWDELLSVYDQWSFCQMQYNFMDEDAAPGRRGLCAAAEKGLAVIVMEPLRGGQLTKRPPQSVLDLWAETGQTRTPAEWALHWVWSQPEVSLVLSGMSTLEQVEQNVAAADRSRPGLLTADELAVVGRVRDEYRGLRPVDCTQCRYCQPCPSGVDIPQCFEVYNDAHMYGELDLARLYYSWIDESARADNCTQCGECERVCPQNLAIIDSLRQVDAFFA